MKYTIILTVAAAAIVTLSSCGTGKKLEAANASIASLQSANTDLSSKVAAQQKQLEEFAATRKTALAEFDKYRTACEATKTKLDKVNADLAKEEASLKALEDKVSAALVDFDGKGVEVYEKDGEVYVSMQDNLLYKPGSSALGANGKKALGNLASALNDYPNLKVTVVGNTDSIAYKKGTMDNLALSTERANGVVRVLRDDYKISGARLTSAGKGKFNPIADNATAEGRAKNRRTDIILNPDLEKLMESVQ